MNRREFMQCAALLVSGAAASSVGLALTEEQKHFVASNNYIAGYSDYLNDAQRRVVAAISEVILPATDTPGAIDAGVPKFIELMVADWFNDQERNIFDRGLEALMTSTLAKFGKTFDQLAHADQLAILEKLEDDASDSPWYAFGNTQREFISDAPFICQMKELTIWGFFTSEVGSTQVLRYEPMPMEFDGDRELGPNDSSWSSNIF